jgi:hypothetical protein
MAEIAPSNLDKQKIPAARELDELKRTGDSILDLTGLEPGKRAAALNARLSPEGRIALWQSHEITKWFSKKIKSFAAPALHQFSDSPRAVAMYQQMRTLFTSAVARSNVSFFGRPDPPKSAPRIGQVFERRGRTGSLEDVITRLTDDGLRDVNEARTLMMSPAEMKAAGMDASALRYARATEKLDEKYLTQLQATIKYSNDSGSEAKALTKLRGHYMVSRSWEGSYRVKIFDDAEKFVAMGSGKTAKLAKADAEAQIAAASERGLKLKADLAETESWGWHEDLREAMKMDLQSPNTRIMFEVRKDILKSRTPGRFEERTGIQGFQQHLSKKQLKEMTYNHILESERFMAEKSVRIGLREDFEKLLLEHPHLAKQLQDRLDRMAGIPSGTELKVRGAVDHFPAPFIGGNSASEIVRITNRTLFASTLGMGDLGFVALNALTPIQTVMPELAFVMTAPPKRMAHLYSPALVMGANRVHVVHHMSPMKIMRQSFKNMRDPSDELREFFTKAQNDLTISPRFIETFVGESSQTVLSLKKAVTGDQKVTDFTRWLLRLGEYLPGKSEELSRGFAFTAGYNVGKSVMGLEGKTLYRFASEFVGRTMYNYGVGDRPRVITGSVGTLFGLFKNWSMHYFANFMTYTGEGVMRGNWSPLLWQNVGTFALAGVGAVPGYGIAERFSKLISDKTFTEQAYELFGYAEPVAGEWATEKLSDAFYMGLPAFFGVSLQGRAAPPGSELVRDINMLFSTALWDRLVHGSRFVNEAVDHWHLTGENPLGSRRVVDEFWRAFTPRTWYRFAQTTAERGVRSLSTGNLLISPITIPERVKFVMGLTPTQIEKAYFVNDELFKDQNKMRERVSAFGYAIAEARGRGDWREAIRLHRDAWTEGIPSDSVEKSAQSYEQKMTEPLLQRQFDDYAARRLSDAMRVRR